MAAFLTAFIGELREAGVPVSMVEAVDAARALEHVDIESRLSLKAALGATLVKSARHIDAFDAAFEAFFALMPPGGEDADRRALDDQVAVSGSGGAGAGASEVEDLVAALFSSLRDGDLGLMQSVVRSAVTRLAGMEPGRPVGGAYYLYRVLRRLELDEVGARLRDELETPGASPIESRLTAEEVERRLEEFREALRAEIRRRLVADRGRQAVARTLRRPLVEDLDLTTASRDDLARVEAAVHPLTRKLASRLARRRRRGRDGRLDVRRTVRSSLQTGGVPIDPRFRTPRPTKPEIVLLTDISGSVATFARFTMQFVYAIAAQLNRVRTFAFIDTIDEVTRFFGPGVDFTEALRRVGTEAEVVWLDGHSDYGNAFGTFVLDHFEAITPRSIVIVTGDARTNYHDPNPAALARIASVARSVYWLNPERRRYWDTGDSVMGAYAAVCDEVHEVRSLRQLERFVEKVAIPVSRPVRRLV
ncbi:MAG: VWA domain-containing protein [Acidimicrobiia bacterium]